MAQATQMERVKEHVQELEKSNRAFVEQNFKLQTSLQAEVSLCETLKVERDRSVRSLTPGFVLRPCFIARLTGLQAQFENERSVLQLEVEKLEAERSSLLREHHALEVSCAEAKTLSALLSTQLKEQKTDNLKCVVFHICLLLRAR